MSEGGGDRNNVGRPTLRQVAAVAGVSIKTASRALRGEGYVAAATAVRVHDAARQVGFRLNALASELRQGGTSNLVGLVTGDLANPFYATVAGGIERELRARGLQLVTASTDEDPIAEQDLIDALLQRRVRALLIASSSTDHTHLADEAGRGVPLVFVDRPPVGVQADTVLIDNRTGAGDAVRHLIAGGHRRIGVVADLSRLATQQARIDGVGDAMSDAGIDDWRELFRPDAHDVAAAQTTVDQLLDMPDPPTALFTLNNRITAGALRALQQARIDGRLDARAHRDPESAARKLPALIGFDDFELSDVLGVSVIGYAAEEMGRTAARLALDRLEGVNHPAQTVVLPTTLIERGSGERRP
ncbi:LacI family DNA-binding transcriptional regulator [Nakamurella lactea]|uniref:LacI family DNA-binding transcriptional regulator n=1 Tax=Nakamurella lactea TaxID=459515 RepID=UPI0003FC1611|nr:LacI family DNA-binding transcriptional regulator [Nakamurella lactea]